MPLKFDIQNENFDYYFLEQASLMSEAQKELLPKELLYKIFSKGHRINSKSSRKLTFYEKLYVLAKACNKKWSLVVEDEKNGIDVEAYKKLLSKKVYDDQTEKIVMEGQFILAIDELFETFHKLNYLSVRPAYNYLQKIKTKNYLKPDDYKRNMVFLAKWLNNYESKRKKIVMESGLTMAEWITLTYLYDGEQKNGSFLYEEKFKYCYNSSSAKIKMSFRTLQDKGFIIRYGIKRGAKFEITALGKAKLASVMEKYAVNC